MTRLSVCLTAFILVWSCIHSLSAAVQKLDFSFKKFEEPMNTEFWERHLQPGIEIDSSVRFKDQYSVIFCHPVYFARVQFNSRVHLSGVKFNFIASFIGAKFHSTAYFCEAQFHSMAKFYAARFDSIADFAYAQFDSTADFGIVSFHSKADFNPAYFDGEANFSRTFFGDKANFSGATFDTMADFRSAQFRGKVNFGDSKLPCNLDFRYVTEITREIDFTYCLPPSKDTKCRIALEGTDISKIKLNMYLFDLWFPADTIFRDSVYGDDTIKVVIRNTNRRTVVDCRRGLL